MQNYRRNAGNRTELSRLLLDNQTWVELPLGRQNDIVFQEESKCILRNRLVSNQQCHVILIRMFEITTIPINIKIDTVKIPNDVLQHVFKSYR